MNMRVRSRVMNVIKRPVCIHTGICLPFMEAQLQRPNRKCPLYENHHFCLSLFFIALCACVKVVRLSVSGESERVGPFSPGGRTLDLYGPETPANAGAHPASPAVAVNVSLPSSAVPAMSPSVRPGLSPVAATAATTPKPLAPSTPLSSSVSSKPSN